MSVHCIHWCSHLKCIPPSVFAACLFIRLELPCPASSVCLELQCPASSQVHPEWNFHRYEQVLVIWQNATQPQGNQVALSNTASFLPRVFVFVEELAARNSCKSPSYQSDTIPMSANVSPPMSPTLPDMVIPVGRYPTW